MIDKISVLKIMECTSVDGPGLRTSVYCAGCVNRCAGCHNPQSWDINSGSWMSIDDIFAVIVNDDEVCNVTFSGGDPMYQPLAFAELAKRIKMETNKTIWCYSGYTFEHIKNDKDKMELLKWIDVLVDGKYVQALRDERLVFRGSSNQRVIDVKASLESDKIVLFEYNPFPEIDFVDYAHSVSCAV